MEGYDEVLDYFLDMLPLERRLASVPPRQRFAGLDRNHQAMGLPIDVVRVLPESYVQSLSPFAQAALRLRLQQEDDS